MVFWICADTFVALQCLKQILSRMCSMQNPLVPYDSLLSQLFQWQYKGTLLDKSLRIESDWVFPFFFFFYLFCWVLDCFSWDRRSGLMIFLFSIWLIGSLWHTIHTSNFCMLMMLYCQSPKFEGKNKCDTLC